MSILHIAPQNIAGVPWRIVKEERRRGFDSWLITMSRHPYGFGEDECLELPFAADGLARLFQKSLSTTPEKINARRGDVSEKPPIWKGSKFPANKLFDMRDRLWKPKLYKAGFPCRLLDYNIIVLDGGLPLLRSGKWLLPWAKATHRLATTYYGTDLRQHGVIREIDAAAGMVFAMEFDHLALHPRATWLPFPFDTLEISPANPPDSPPVRIGHAVVTRSSKGSDAILAAIAEVAKDHDIEPVLIERLPYKEALELKSTCHIFIDQLGELGYGLSGLESLAMGIPTVVELLPDHEEFIGKHPFVIANSDTLADVLRGLIDDEPRRRELTQIGPKWVAEFHSPARTVDIIHEKYHDLGWL